jgi:hypothetical protein
MRIAAVIGVKDEAELIVPCIERLHAIGVGPIVVLDDHSTDGTAELVDRLASTMDGTLTRVVRTRQMPPVHDRAGPVLGPLIEEHRPDWVLFTDADEFWVCRDGQLVSALGVTASDALSIERFNVPLMSPPFIPISGLAAAMFLEAPIIVKRTRLSPDLMRLAPHQRWIMHAVMPKLVCRTERVGSFSAGGHAVTAPDGSRIVPAPAGEITIVHVPFTTLPRFVRKVDNARHFLDRWSKHYPGEAA